MARRAIKRNDLAGTFLIYGSYGYTGALVLELAAGRRLRPVLGGRDEHALAEQARAHKLEYRAFDLDDPAAIAEKLEGVRVVLNCAGPFHRTAEPIAQACLRAGVHYLDITGEIAVFESLARRNDAARRAKIMLLPGCGFDVVPTDCLAAHLKSRLPDATRLVLAFQGLGRFSRGTATTAIESMMRAGAVRRDGAIVSVPTAWKTRQIDFGEGPIETVTVPWGDVSTAYYSTGIGNIEVYMALPPSLIRQMRLGRYVSWLLALPPVQSYLKLGVRAGPPGPSAKTRRETHSLVWGSAANAFGRSVTSRLRTPNGYALTAMTALRAAERALAGKIKPGFQTPSTAFGKDFIMEFEGVSREDVD